jgi:hypothetical protein
MSERIKRGRIEFTICSEGFLLFSGSLIGVARLAGLGILQTSPLPLADPSYRNQESSRAIYITKTYSMLAKYPRFYRSDCRSL